MAFVNSSTTIVDASTTDVATVTSSVVDAGNDTLFIRDVSASGAAQFKQITFAQASALFSGSLVITNPGASSTWASDLSSNPPTAPGQQRHYQNSLGEFARFISNDSSTSAWVFFGGVTMSSSSPAGSITPLGFGQHHVVRFVNEGVVTVSSTWIAAGPSSSNWRQTS
jgi:hypothetical protein